MSGGIEHNSLISTPSTTPSRSHKCLISDDQFSVLIERFRNSVMKRAGSIKRQLV